MQVCQALKVGNCFSLPSTWSTWQRATAKVLHKEQSPVSIPSVFRGASSRREPFSLSARVHHYMSFFKWGHLSNKSRDTISSFRPGKSREGGVTSCAWCTLPFSPRPTGSITTYYTIAVPTEGHSPKVLYVFLLYTFCKETHTPMSRVVRKNFDMVMKGAIFSFGIIWKVHKFNILSAEAKLRATAFFRSFRPDVRRNNLSNSLRLSLHHLLHCWCFGRQRSCQNSCRCCWFRRKEDRLLQEKAGQEASWRLCGNRGEEEGKLEH